MNVAHATLGTERRFARTAQMKLSPIKEIELAASRIPGVVSLAQGIPSFDTPEPIKAVRATKDRRRCVRQILAYARVATVTRVDR